MRVLRVILAVLLCLAWGRNALAYGDDEVIDGFRKTVFGAEYAGLFTPSYVRKFTDAVRLDISSFSPDLRAEVERFVLSLNGYVRGLRIVLVRSPAQANFRVHIVRRRDYEATVRTHIAGATGPVRGKCVVRAKFTSNGITRSDAVIVGDDSAALFRRCMVEEILQGLGPLNDHPSLVHSVFNDRSVHTSFRRFDRLIMNMLYDPRIRAGMTETEAEPLLRSVLRDVRNQIEGR